MAIASESKTNTVSAIESTEAPSSTGMNLDPIKMQEMLNPQTMQAYMTQVSLYFP
jgi:hypothetical protein